MISTKATFSIAALACAWLGLAGCDGGWQLDAKSILEAARDKPTTTPTKPDGTVGEKPTGDKPSSDPAKDPGKDPGKEPPPSSEGIQCKVATDAKGTPCKVCYDPTGKVLDDGCGTSGAAGTGGAAPAIKCESTTDTTTGVVCKTCYYPDGKIFDHSCTPVPQPGSIISCDASTDEATGQVCKVCKNDLGDVTFTDCGAPAAK